MLLGVVGEGKLKKIPYTTHIYILLGVCKKKWRNKYQMQFLSTDTWGCLWYHEKKSKMQGHCLVIPFTKRSIKNQYMCVVA